MSYSSLFIIDEDGDVEESKEYQNSHGFAMPVWMYLAKKYLYVQGEDPHKFWARGYLHEKIEPVFKLKADPRLDRWEWICLLTSFDNAMVKKRNLEEVSAAFLMFDGLYRAMEPQNVCHYATMAGDLKRLAEAPEVQGVAWNATSVSESPWNVRDTCICTACGLEHQTEEERHYNITKDKKHWFVFDYACPRTLAEAKK